MAIYQKYRAQKFGEVIAQSHVKDVLQNSIKNDTFGHAYLFVGTRGTGKTSLARIFARTINCEKQDYVKENLEPCNECSSCIEAINGSNVDIIELDAASNRGIEEVRNLIEGVDFLPSGGKYKVYIIDEVHMMTKEAFNALLKTVEEPPKHAVFVMCTTEFFKVPPTIISRSQVFELKHATIEEIIQKMDKVLEREGIKITLEGKKIIAKLGKGSFRDSESILEKVINSSDKKELDETEVTEILGLTSILLIENIKEKLYQKDLNSVQEIIFKELDDGVISVFNTQLSESIYSDLVDDLSKDNIDDFKIELFSLISSISLKNISSPKFFYISKLLNFLKDFKPHKSRDPEVLKEQVVSHQEVEKHEVEKIDMTSKKFSTNPAALLRERKRLNEAAQQKPQTPNPAETQVKNQTKKISKMDFLEFIKSKNLFLYRLFLHNDFSINGDAITVDVKTRMQKDLLSKPQNKNLIQEFASMHRVSLHLVFGDVQLDKRTTVERNISQTKKKVEDLNEDEIGEIFGK